VEALPGVCIAETTAAVSADERPRHDSFRSERDRRLFRATRMLVLAVLSRYAAVAPCAWRFAAHAQGKPYIASPAVTPNLHFNLSNTAGLVVCAVSVAHEVGVDAERVDREVPEVAFCAAERAALRALPPGERARRQFDYWTLKERYLKARGDGLAGGLDRVGFVAGAERIELAAEHAGDAGRWRFALLALLPQHAIAVSADTGAAPLSVRAAWMGLA
jgi:4'-phosphopantetheinyl transferase